MSREFFDPDPEDSVIVFVEEATIRRVERLIEGCERCTPAADVPFDWVCDKITGHDPSVTDYILERPATCPRCQGSVTEKTLVQADWK
jgi:hypothetical protein